MRVIAHFRRAGLFLVMNSFLFLFIWNAAPVVSQVLPLDPRTLTKYVDLLPQPSVIQPVTPGGTYYEVGMWQTMQTLHQALPPTTVWAYGVDSALATYPGPTFEAKRGVPITVKWTNNLNGITHPLPVDQTLHWADPFHQHSDTNFNHYLGPVPTVVHLHGAEVEAPSDGHPEAWFTPNFDSAGMGFVKQTYEYNNNQQPTTLWYHDHALGITRLNVYMGLAGFYILRDSVMEISLNLPKGAYEREIVIQDRSFNTDGSLAFDAIGINPTIHPFWVPEFLGNTIVVNGKVWPYMNVEPRKYRFRFLNGSNARFYELRLWDKVNDLPGPAFYQIGTDGGYLNQPVMLNDPLNPNAPRLILAPGERADVIIDFGQATVGTIFTMVNSARAPYPKGTTPNPQTVGQIMQFRVVALTAPDSSQIPATLNTIPMLVQDAPTRTLTLNEVMGPLGPIAMFLDGKKWMDGVTEMPKVGTTEMWEIVNLTADTHPIHLHLVQFQPLDRQKFNLNKYSKAYQAANPVIPVPDGVPYVTVPVTPYLQGPAKPADPNETGWKDTYRSNPGEVSRILVRFAPQDGGTFSFNPGAEPGYVWHCHILDHEDNEMMRPFKVDTTSTPPIIVAKQQTLPATYSLNQNYPNPFNLQTEISFYLSEKSEVELTIYNLLGQKVKTLAKGEFEPGTHTLSWDGTNESGVIVASGIYFYRIETGVFSQSKKMVLMK